MQVRCNRPGAAGVGQTPGLHARETLLSKHQQLLRPQRVVGSPQSVVHRLRSVQPTLGTPPLDWAPVSVDDTVQEILRNTLRSAYGVIGASGGFVLLLTEGSVLEIAALHRVSNNDVLDTLFGWAAGALHCALLDGSRGLAGADGQLLDGEQEEQAAVFVCLPLDIDETRRGALCLLRKPDARALKALDLEILDALAGQAALALAAGCQRHALHQLQARLQALDTPEF